MTKPTKRNDDEEKRKSSTSLPPSNSSKPIEFCITVQKPPDPPGRAQTPPLTSNAGVKDFLPPTTTSTAIRTINYGPIMTARQLMINALQQLPAIYNVTSTENSEKITVERAIIGNIGTIIVEYLWFIMFIPLDL
jgi:hypothetical protein